MNSPFQVILLVIGIIAIVAILEVLVLAIPLVVSLSIRNQETKVKGVLAVSWFIFGLEVLVPGNNPQISVLVCGARLITRPLSFITGPGKESGREGPGQVPWIVSSLFKLQGPLLNAILDVVHHIRLDYVRGTARFGFSDPGATGMLYGLYWAVRAMLPMDRVNLTVIPDFNNEVLDVDITTRFRITYPFLAIINAIKIAKHPAARKVMKTMRAKLKGAAS